MDYRLIYIVHNFRIELYLLFIPLYDSGTYFGVKWMMTLWKDSKDEVWCIGERRHISLQSIVFVISAVTFSLALVSRKLLYSNSYYNTRQKKKNIYIYLRLLNHFLLWPWSGSGGCKHSGKTSLWPLCTLWMWFSRESHLAFITPPSPCSRGWGNTPIHVIKLLLNVATLFLLGHCI